METVMHSALTAPPISAIVDAVTGEPITNLSRRQMHDAIARGMAIETVPVNPLDAKRWVADLVERVMFDAHQRGLVDDIPAFEEYARWCAARDIHELPISTENLTLYLLGLLIEGTAQHEITLTAYSLERIHGLANHPPRHLSKLGLASFHRAITFAKAKLSISDLNELERQAPLKALAMFPGGEVPARLSDVG